METNSLVCKWAEVPEEFYKNDEKHGKFKYWFDNGRLEEEKFSNGVQTDGKHYDYFDN